MPFTELWPASRLRVRVAMLALMVAAFTGTSFAQIDAAPTAHVETPQELVARLTPEQKQQFDSAIKAARAHQFSQALAAYKSLLKELPGDPVLSKYASDTALNSGDIAFAVATLKPIAQATPDDWPAASLLTRACAESGDAACRDAGIAHMLDLKKRGLTPPTMQEYIVEHLQAGANQVVIWASLEPLGKSKSYNFAQVSDEKGDILLQLTLESSDKDQAQFAREHQYQASQGIRAFSINSYKQTPPNKQGQRSMTHDTYKIFTGQPTYTEVKERFLKIANGKGGDPLSSNTTLIAAEQKP